MSESPATARPNGTDWFLLAVRWLLAALFIYLGLSKALHPVEFLKLVRQYDVLSHHVALNTVAAALPWFEVVCGLLLLLGVAVRGTAVVLGATLAAFTGLIALRAANLYEAGALPFCAIKFDCGCGTGEVFVCRKLAENIALLAAAACLVVASRCRFCLRHSLFK